MGRHTIVHRAWLILLVAAQLSFLVVMPAGSGNDEQGHLLRMWAVSDGHFFCRTVPQAVRDLELFNRGPYFKHPRSFRGYWQSGLQLGGGAQRVDGSSYECFYFPLGVTLPALAARAVAMDFSGVPRRGGVFLGSYAGRLAALVTLDAALIAFLWLVPWARTVALAFFSIPMVIEQSVSVGHDGMLLTLCLLLSATVWARDSWRAVAVAALLVSLMTVTKPIFAPLGLLSLPMIVRLTPSFRALPWRRRLLAFGGLAPLLSYGLWAIFTRLTDRSHPLWRPSFTNPVQQALGLVKHPLRALSVLFGYWHYFIDDGKLPDFTPHRINGVWTTLFFANLSFEISTIAYLLAIVGLAAALVGDATAPTQPSIQPMGRAAPEGSARRLRWAETAALAGVLSIIPGTVLIMYLIFTPVGQGGAYGVQGRYHAVAWLVLSLLALAALQRRRAHPWRGSIVATVAAAAAMLAADGWAIAGIWHYYWI